MSLIDSKLRSKIDKIDEPLVNGAERELLEETPIRSEWISNRSEIPIGNNNYVSPGATNEQVFLYRFDIKVPNSVDLYDILDGKICGVASEGEKIISQVVTFTQGLITQLPIESHKLAVAMILLDEKS